MTLPTYDYRPARSGPEPEIQSRSNRRARLFKGGTYFRSRERGRAQNNLSVAVVQYTEPTAAVPDASCVVTNYNPKPEEQVIGPVTVDLFECNLTYSEYVQIEDLTTQPRARRYSISLQIGAAPVLEEELGPFAFGRIFTLPGKLVVKLTPDSAGFTPSDVITIKPRIVSHRLEVETPPPSDTAPTPTPIWSITKLRTAVNGSNPWIEMMPRALLPGDAGGPPTPNPAGDKQDEEADALTGLAPFAETRLAGADGLPLNPADCNTGPSRSLIHLNYDEQQNGSLQEVSVVYEWVGQSATIGSWNRY